LIDAWQRALGNCEHALLGRLAALLTHVKVRSWPVSDHEVAYRAESDFSLLCDLERVIDLDPKITDRALEFRMSQ
jgi:hypothetical protein